MNKRRINFIIAFLSPILLSAQSKTIDCSRVKEGTFYFYPLGSKVKFMVIRDNTMQREINIQTSDTSFWKVNWANDCVLSLRFINSSRPMSNAQISFFNSHTTVVQVLGIAKDYYVFKGGLDSINRNSTVDTMWIRAR